MGRTVAGAADLEVSNKADHKKCMMAVGCKYFPLYGNKADLTAGMFVASVNVYGWVYRVAVEKGKSLCATLHHPVAGRGFETTAGAAREDIPNSFQF